MTRPRQKNLRRGKGPISSQTPDQRRARRIARLRALAERQVAAIERKLAWKCGASQP